VASAKSAVQGVEERRSRAATPSRNGPAGVREEAALAVSALEPPTLALPGDSDGDEEGVPAAPQAAARAPRHGSPSPIAVARRREEARRFGTACYDLDCEDRTPDLGEILQEVALKSPRYKEEPEEDLSCKRSLHFRGINKAAWVPGGILCDFLEESFSFVEDAEDGESTDTIPDHMQGGVPDDCIVLPPKCWTWPALALMGASESEAEEEEDNAA